MKVFAGHGTARTFDYRAGDVGYLPFGNGHCLWFLEMFKSNRNADVSLNLWMALTPSNLVRVNLHVGPELLDALRKVEWPVVKYPGFSYYPKSRLNRLSSFIPGWEFLFKSIKMKSICWKCYCNFRAT